MGKVKATIADHPWIVTLLLVAAVVVHLGLASVAALTAGFAGVVVVFVLQSSSPRFRRFRYDAAGSVRSWSISVIGAPTAAALIGLAAALLAALSRTLVAAWVLELGLLVLLHGLVRMMFFFGAMITLVQYDDTAEIKDDRKKAAALRMLRGGGRAAS